MASNGFYLLLDGYLHQDWDLQFNSIEEAIRGFVYENSNKTVERAIRDIDEILKSRMSESRLNKSFRMSLGRLSKRFPHPRWRNTFLWFKETIEVELDERKLAKKDISTVRAWLPKNRPRPQDGANKW